MSPLGRDFSSKRYWRSLDELAENSQFQDWMSREFPTAASELPSGLSRRRWMQLMGASLAFGGISGCRWEAEQFAPFTVRPQNRTPGSPQFFSTMWELAGVARPLTVTSLDGRPIKIEGNQQHPASLGATTAFDQALVLSMYDPDRSSGLLERVRSELLARTWEEFERVLARRLESHTTTQGRGLALVREKSSSPTQQRLLQRFAEKYPEAIICDIDVGRNQSVDQATQTVFGKTSRQHINLQKARVIACFDADPFGQHPDSVRLIREWSNGRDPGSAWMNRLYCFESHLSLTGSNADHRVPVKSATMLDVLRRVETALESTTGGPTSDVNASKLDLVVTALANDLTRHAGASLLLAGPHQPPAVHEKILRLNSRLKNFGSTLELLPVPETTATSVPELLHSMDNGRVDTLFILDANPAFGNEHAAAFRTAMSKVPFTVHSGLYRDETARLCRWHLPVAHPLETWSDARSFDGTVTVSQPLIAPLFNGRSLIEMLARIVGDQSSAQGLIRDTLVGLDTKYRDEKQWRRVVHDGFALMDRAGGPTASPAPLPTAAATAGDSNRDSDSNPRSAEEAVDPPLEVVITHSSTTFDGRFANNGWLQETPDAISKLTWDNAALIGPSTARELQLRHGDVVRIEANQASVELPLFVLPGVADGSIQLSLGYGRTAAGHVGGLVDEGVDPVGADVSVLLPTDGTQILTEVRITATGDRRDLATTQDHFAIDVVGLEAIGARLGELVRTGSLAEYREHPDFAQHRGPHHPPTESLWEERSYDGHAWGMSIDLNRCIGCNACTVACQSENNIPIVGREQVLAGREMHWIRIDRYFGSDPDDPEVAHQPVTCHHCENAPCEQVCPVAATVHSDEGLNDMVYNRCIGTRYCANNCPYKVRRFNFLDYNAALEDPANELVQLVINPEVTVRSRGVMEKCTYCVQRIQDTKITAKNERRPIADGEIRTACQSACPAEAIVFGDLNDPDSGVARAHADSRAYGMLAELNTKPRTKYLARIRNPHPWLDTGVEHSEAEHA